MNAKVYIKVNENDEIVDINSNIFLKDTTGYICIDEGEGDRYAHAQGHYLPEPLQSDNGQYNFIYRNGAVERKGE